MAHSDLVSDDFNVGKRRFDKLLHALRQRQSSAVQSNKWLSVPYLPSLRYSKGDHELAPYGILEVDLILRFLVFPGFFRCPFPRVFFLGLLHGSLEIPRFHFLPLFPLCFSLPLLFFFQLCSSLGFFIGPSPILYVITNLAFELLLQRFALLLKGWSAMKHLTPRPCQKNAYLLQHFGFFLHLLLLLFNGFSSSFDLSS